MKRSTVYLLFSILGIVAPFVAFSGFLRDENASIPYFFTSIFANPAASTVAVDWTISAIVFFIFLFAEGRRMGLKHLWVYVPLTFLVGLCFALPLFLYKREKVIEGRAE